MNILLHSQYGLVKGSREVLFDYCDAIDPKHFISEVNGFGRGGSIRNLLVHVGNVYQYWIGAKTFGREEQFPAFEEMADMAACRRYFEQVDGWVDELTRSSADDAVKVFTHVITHEFHHKGQILSISRHLGYTPVDTDIIR
jgi:uncharacterized damage-inducible protein DinB